MASCAGDAKTPVDQAAAADQRLQGTWRLLSFQPSLAMEEPLRGLLDAQLSTMTIQFGGGQLSLEGPNVSTTGRYEITGAGGDAIRGRVYDRAGAAYGISGQFVASELRFTSEDAPWAGFGVLQRLP